MSKEFAAYSAVALIEAPDSFVTHRRRSDLEEGTLAYPGMGQFLGGHRDTKDGQLELATTAIIREISEETNLGELPGRLFKEYWQGSFEGKGKDGEPTLRHVTCFHLGLTATLAAKLRLAESEGGELMHIPKKPEAIDELFDQLTPFAYRILSAYVIGAKPEDRKESYVSTH